MKFKVVVLVVTIMFPHITLGQYCFVVDYNNGELLKIELNNPTNEIIIGTSMQFLTDAEFGSNNVLYAVPLSGTQFYQIDTTTAAITQIGTATPLNGHMWSGLAYDVTTSTLYASSTTGNSASAIYTIDVSTGTASHIGTTTAAQSIADIAFDNNGQMYAHNLSNTIYLIDKTNGSATLLGNTGFNAAGPWHGLDYSFHNNTMYMATYNSITWEKTIRTVNLTTGNTTSVGTINHFAGGFAILNPESSVPNITVVPESLIFDTTAVGSSNLKLLTIYNTGTETLTINDIISADSVFSVNTDSFNVLPGGNQIVLVTFVPDQPMNYNSDLFIINNDPETDTLVVPLTGVGFILAPEISVDPVALAFDTTAVGSSIVKLLSIYNTGNATLTISSILSTESVFSTNFSSYDLSPGDSQMVQVVFTPIESITYTGNLFVISNDSEMDTLVVPVSGVGIVLSGIDSDIHLPYILSLYPNYPNPFNPVTTLRYDLPENSYVNVTVYDILGRQVRTLVKTTQEAGFKSVIWDATNDFGKPVSAGVYLYQIQAGEFVQTKKMVLLK